MTPIQTGKTMQRARHLLRAGKLSRTDIAVLDCLVFSCRGWGQTRLTVSYSRLCRLVRAARATVVASIKRLIECRLLTKHRRGRLVVWSRGMAWRQMPNIYELLAPDCEFSAGPVPQSQKDCIERKRPVGPVRTVEEQLLFLRGVCGVAVDVHRQALDPR